jgi:transcription elongation factor Elf1
MRHLIIGCPNCLHSNVIRDEGGDIFTFTCSNCKQKFEARRQPNPYKLKFKPLKPA